MDSNREVRMKTYLFDFDGTLVDSMPTFISVMLRILDENHIEYGEDIVKIITPLGYAGTAKYYRESLGVSLSEECLIDTMHRYAADAYAYDVQAKKSVIETLRRMKERGDDLNVLTASPHDMLDPCLKRLGIFELFSNVWSCEDFGTTKSNPDIYRMAARKIGKPVDEIIFVDDNYNADLTAKAAGMTVFGIYDESSAEYEEQIRAVTDGYARTFDELLV